MSDLSEAEKRVKNLYHFRDHYFDSNGVEKASQRIDDVKAHLAETIAFLNTQLGDESVDVKTKAKLSFFRGHALNILADHDPKAEECLSRAVKLDPTLSEAWNSLGECFWKAGNIESARHCFNGVLSHGKDKTALRNLSMVLRQLGKNSEEKRKNILLSVEKAKEAVAIDLTDGMSWYILGNAYMSLFFMGGQPDSVLKQCLAAYSRAEKDPVAANNADLHYNRAIAYKHEEQYCDAFEGFSRAGSLDPSWKEPGADADQLSDCLRRIDGIIKTKGKLKSKRLASMQASLSEKDLGPYMSEYKSVSGRSVSLSYVKLEDLKPGHNEGCVILGRVVGQIIASGVPSLTAVLMTREGTCTAVTAYNVASGVGFIIGDAVAIPEPKYQKFVVTLPNKDVVSLPSIRVDTPTALVVNRRRLSRDKLALSSLEVICKSE